ncbi:LysR substrate-binding domain-containing protein [uncultured Hyphomonas sp.]|uniref:LysR family transcriptional regulator n=1 Tax=uncultured Hyphomonas sp. TaxID=225298 RepID=UPI002AABEE2D|nr:LysR substrate-binding domain-containing protein [uncultured Hyphomonas sp.]
MDTRQMRYFVALAETLHFGEAAARMNMTQPPFSRQIANLERGLGVQLVERTSRSVALTPAGKRFLEESRNVLARFDDACQNARLVAQGVRGELSFGFMMHAAHSVVPEIIRRFINLRPDVRMSVSETIPADAERLLLKGELDAAITFAGRAMPQLDSLPVFTDRLCVVLPSGHRLAERKSIRPNELQDEDLIAAASTVAPTLRAAINACFEREGVLPRVRFEPQLQNTILRLVAANLGVALVPGSICDERISGVIAVPLSKAPALEVVLKTRRKHDNPAVEILVDLVRNGFQQAHT